RHSVCCSAELDGREMKRALLILGTASALLSAQDWSREVSALKPAPTDARGEPFLHHLDSRAHASLQAISHAQTPAEAGKARPGLRRELEHALGIHQMPWPPALKAQVTGAVRRHGYRIEKIVYEALPGEKIAAHLYVPEP